MITTSVVIATHNRASLVGRAVDSVLQDPPSGCEVIVVNDGSTDDTARVLERYGPRIHCIHRQHGERSAARNAGIEAATGRFIVFLDDDDELLPGGVAHLTAALQSAPECVVAAYGNPLYCGPGSSTLEEWVFPRIGPEGNILAQLLAGNFVPIGALIVRRAELLAIQGFRSTYIPMEDWHLCIRLAQRGEFRYVNQPIARIWRHGQNTEASRFRPAQAAYFTSSEFKSLLQELQASAAPEELRRLGEVLTGVAQECQHRSDFRNARGLMSLVPKCGRPYPLVGPEQLWRSWLPRIPKN